MIRRFADPSSMMLWFDLDDTLWDMSGNSVVCLRELYESQRLDRVFASPEGGTGSIMRSTALCGISTAAVRSAAIT